MTYLQHGARHRPDGTDPILPAGSLFLPNAIFSNSTLLSSPITNPTTALAIPFDTIQTDALGADYFSLSGSAAQAIAGVYLVAAGIQFAHVVDWHTVGPIAELGVGTSGSNQADMATTIPISANPSDLNHMSVSTIVFPTTTETINLAFEADGITTLPSGIAVAQMWIMRVGAYSITL